MANEPRWGENYRLRRYHDARNGDTVSVETIDSDPGRPTIRMSPWQARHLARALEAAADWEDGA